LSRDLLEMLIVTWLVTKFPTFYGTWRFIHKNAQIPRSYVEPVVV